MARINGSVVVMHLLLTFLFAGVAIMGLLGAKGEARVQVAKYVPLYDPVGNVKNEYSAMVETLSPVEWIYFPAGSPSGSDTVEAEPACRQEFDVVLKVKIIPLAERQAQVAFSLNEGKKGEIIARARAC